MLAFLGRYGHQDMLKWKREATVLELKAAADAVAKLIEEETETLRLATDG